MSEEQKQEQVTSKATETTAANNGSTGADAAPRSRGRGERGGARRSFGGKKPGLRKGSRFRSERPKPEFEQKIVNISRVTRVVKGGRRLSFRVDMVIGDKKGRVGLGSGKATDTSLAIQKAFNHARKNLIKVGLTPTGSIPHSVEVKVSSSRIDVMPNKGRGLVVGSTLRTVFELAGVTDVTARVNSRSKNKLNNAKAAVEALRTFSVPMDPVTDTPREEGRGGRRFGDRGGNRERGARRGAPVNR